MATTHTRDRIHLGSADRSARDRRLVPEAASAHDGAQPGHVRRRGRQRADDAASDPGRRRPAAAISASSCRLRSGSGSRCSSPTSPKRWPKAAARRRPTRCGRAKTETIAKRERPDGTHRSRAGASAAQGRHRARRSRRGHPGRRRDHRRRRVGRRIGHHRRVRAGDSRVGRRPLGGDRRHASALGLDQRAGHGESWRDVPRSHDRAGRRRRAAEDAERDRAQHPARRADDRLPARRGHAAAVRDLLGRAAVAVRAGRRCSSA